MDRAGVNVRYGDVRQVGTTLESTFSNRVHAVGDRDGRQSGTILESVHSDACHTFGNDEGGSAGTERSHHGVHHPGHVGRCIVGGQVDAAGECIVPDDRHGLRNRDAGQRCAALKGVLANACNTLFNNDFSYFFVVGKKIVVTNGFIKKTQKTPKNEIELAKKYRNEFINRGDY